MAETLQPFQRNRGLNRKGSDPQTAKFRHLADRAERQRKVARPGPDIGAFAAFHFKNSMIGVREIDQARIANANRPRRKREFLALAGET